MFVFYSYITGIISNVSIDFSSSESFWLRVFSRKESRFRVPSFSTPSWTSTWRKTVRSYFYHSELFRLDFIKHSWYIFLSSQHLNLFIKPISGCSWRLAKACSSSGKWHQGSQIKVSTFSFELLPKSVISSFQLFHLNF